ncbi:phage tail sheath protein [Paenibacillus amylolyticus]|uniref:Phage tail sheath protein n=1 Tax=Paenibacillus amylolyticus TaxID=1451 RepID=A0A1R1C4V1_PAEAM|nr:phage tail sheath family protein [Paenibacillus amylolyticus]OMF17048.1 phage tail sheath protein [Paenibacillus amylolyticus]
MAGGIWTRQNKVRPGVYMNFESVGTATTALGERGTVTMAVPLSWGPSKQLVTVEAGADPFDALGYDITAAEMLPVRETLKRAQKLLLYRLNEGVKATATSGNLRVTGIHGGVRGNDITIVIQANIDDTTKFDVSTLVAGAEQDKQTVSDIDGLIKNAWVTFAASGADKDLTASAGVPLTGGTDGAVTNADHTGYLELLEVTDFNTVGLMSDEMTLKAIYTAFVKRQRENEGKKIQLVVPNYPTADYEGVISVKNGVVLSDQTVIDRVKAVAWVAGATAGAAVSQSLTYAAYDDAVDVDVKYTNSQIEEAMLRGEFLFTASRGRAIVEQDINTFRTYNLTKGAERSKNRVIRVLDGLANDFKDTFEQYYIGKTDNSADGRNLFRSALTNIVNSYQGFGAIQNFNSQTDVSVLAGEAKDSIFVELDIQPVDSIEKIYMRVRVK